MNIGLIYLFNEKNLTAEITSSLDISGDIIIPRSINNNSQEYLITSIQKNALNNCHTLRSISFPENSAVNTISYGAFYLSSITYLHIPASVEELEEGWCMDTGNLIHISISPNNRRYRIFNNKFIIGKSTQSIDEYDVLIFACRDIKQAIIPSTINHISSFSFSKCLRLTKVIFSERKNHLSIGSFAFTSTNIKDIHFPKEINKIERDAFMFYHNLRYVDFDKNSELEVFENDLFSDSSIEKISIPSNIRTIEEYAFYRCFNLKKVYFYENSKLTTIKLNAFSSSSIECIQIPESVTHVDQTAFEYLCKVKSFELKCNCDLSFFNKTLNVSNLNNLFLISFPNSKKISVSNIICYAHNKFSLFTVAYAEINLI